MHKILTGSLAAAAIAALTTISGAGPAAAQVAGARIAAPLAAPATPVVQVQWRRRYWGPRYRYYRGGWGWWGPGAGFATGLIIGGALAPRPYVYYGYPYPRRYYRAYPARGGAVAYCMRRFKSYDRYSRTYLGYDGLRHPCP
jgi:hypothetical protein